MRDPKSIELYNSFEQKIKEFRKNPTKYNFKLNNRCLRKISNAWNTFWIWFIISVGINYIGYLHFSQSTNPLDSSSLIALVMLFFAIGSRSYSVNHIMFDTIGNLGKLYFFHQLANRIGFFHRLMAVSALGWLYIHYQYSIVFQENSHVIFLLIMLGVMIFSALSFFRRKHHNTFENIHRYIGYVSIAVLFLYYFDLNFQNDVTFIQAVIKPHFILLMLIVLMLVVPWIGTKKIYPKLVHTGPHVIGIEIDGEPSFGTYAKISLANGQYHPFGDSMYNFDTMNKRTFYITPSGDRTSQVVYGANNDNFLLEKCTIKRNRHKGFMYHHALYDHILIVVTGGGIAPIIPCLVLNVNTKIDVLWIGRSQTQEFGEDLLTKLTQSISQKEIGLHILDTTEEDLKEYDNANYIDLTLEAYRHYEPEVVFVMSNQNFTVDMMYALEQKNIRSYGATFDS